MDTTLKTEPLATQKRLVGRRVVELMTLCSLSPSSVIAQEQMGSPTHNWAIEIGLVPCILIVILCSRSVYRRRHSLLGILTEPIQTFRQLMVDPDNTLPIALTILIGSAFTVVSLAELALSGAGMVSTLEDSQELIMGIVFIVSKGIAVVTMGGLWFWVFQTSSIWLVARFTGSRTQFLTLLSVVSYSYVPTTLLAGIMISIRNLTEHPASLPALVIGMIFIPLVWSISLVTKGVQFVYGIALPRAVAIVLGTLTVLAAPLASSWVTGEGRYVAMGIAYTFLPAALVLVIQASLQFKELRQARSRLIEEMGKELKTAREMQSRLMPIEHPSGESFGIAGRCSTTDSVGGDYYQYFGRDGRVFVTLAAVNGSAMEAAIPMVMFSGILKTHMEQDVTLENRVARLDRSVSRLSLLEGLRVLLCEFEPRHGTIRLANCGYTQPLHYRAASKDVVELQSADNNLLGKAANTKRIVDDLALASGDSVLFCSSGIVNAQNSSGARYGNGRIARSLAGAGEHNSSAHDVLDWVCDDVFSFTENSQQVDDMFSVVLHVN